ncbi:MAG TPA: phage tail protein, partial [Beijerinckiaceae bacterium]|nr:phage tail protein [Beijerinckiaceae bacterium]
MSFFRAKQVHQPIYTGLQIQTSTNALPIPIVWGVARLAPNAIWYNDFQVHNAKAAAGKGGLFSSPTTGYDYTAAIILALCEGPIAGIGQIWRDQSIYNLAELGLSLFTGTTPQSIWSFLTAAYPAQALAYQGTAFVASGDYDLGASATISNHNFEIKGILQATGINGVDADPAQIINDFLTNAQYGVGFPAASIDASTLFGAGGDASYQTYCKAVGFALSPALTNQESAQTILTRWLQLTNTAAVWSGGLLKFIPYGDEAIEAGTIIATSQVRQIQVPPLPATGVPPSPSIIVATPSTFVADAGVTYAQTGAALAYIGAHAPADIGTYGIFPAGTYLFAPADEGKLVAIAYRYQVAATYAPSLTLLYDLGDDDIVGESGEDPIKVTRSDPFQAYNVWRLEISARDNAYALVPIEVRDQDAIERYGLRVSTSVSAHEICDENVATLAGQLILQRALYIRNTFKFKLAWEFCLLDPMDLVTLDDANLGLSAYPVRITEVEEDEDGLLTVTAEEFVAGVGTAPVYASQGGMAYPVNRNAAVAPVNPPLIFEPPPALVGATPQIWAAVSGGMSGIADPNWGGANVWLSLDGTSYTQIGTVTAPTRQGVTSAALAAFSGANPDVTHTLSVDLTESAGALDSTNAIGAANGATLAIVDREFIAYETATLTAANRYDLTTLYRGLYGSTAAAHSSAAPFARLDDATFKFDLPDSYVGVALFL